MKNLFYPVANLVLCVALTGCVADNPETRDAEVLAPDVVQSDVALDPEDIWICHNPDSEQHGELCIEELAPAGCFVAGSGSVYCWLLTPADCAASGDEPWKKYCTRDAGVL